MGQISDAFRSAFRQYVTNGVESTGLNWPNKSEIQVIGQVIESVISGLVSGVLNFNTVAQMDAVTTSPNGTIALVVKNNGSTSDPLNGPYQWDAGASDWVPAAWFYTALASAAVPLINAAVLVLAETVEGRIFDPVPPDAAGAWIDGDGLAAIMLDASGRFTVHDLGASKMNGRDVRPSGTFDAEVNHIAAYGQSWDVSESISADAAAISLSQPYLNVMFNGGVRPRDAGGTAASQHASLVPHVESDLGNKGESPCFGWSMMIAQLIEQEDGLPWDISGYATLATSAAQSNTNIANLSSGSTPFTNMTTDIQYGHDVVAGAYYQSYAFRAFSFCQGVTDYVDGTLQATWRAALITLQADIDAAAKATNPGNPDVLCILAQAGWAGNYNPTDYPWADLEMLSVSESNPDDFALACPCYFLPKSSDTPHFSNLGNKIRGAYYGIAYKRRLIDKVDHAPLKPIRAYRQGTVLTVQFNPVGRLVDDRTPGAPAVEDFGLTVQSALGDNISITAEIVTRDTVRIICAVNPGANCKVRYGFAATGPGGGNLRDTQGESIVYVDPVEGWTYPMHNWCVIFERIVP